MTKILPMQRTLRWIVGALLLTLAVAGARGEPDVPGSMQNEEDVIAITLLHLNDVYELTPVSGGAEGGLARVATLRKQLRKQNPNTYTILAGDLLNPSALSTATVDDKRLAGRQMVDVMNVMGLDTQPSATMSSISSKKN